MNSVPSCRPNTVPVPAELVLASSNPGKLAEFRVLAADAAPAPRLSLLPNFSAIPAFEEIADTFGENALGKALYYSRHCNEIVFADDSGLVVPALDGAPGVHSARYAGPGATNDQRIAKLLSALDVTPGASRSAYFVCVIAAAKAGRGIAVVSDRVDGSIASAPCGSGGFGYDPIFFFPPMRKTFAQLSSAEKNRHSHRGKAFLRLLAALS